MVTGLIPPKRRVFISFHHRDETYRDAFNERWGHLFTGMDVKLGDISTENSTDYTKRLIQQDHIYHSSVVVALYGAETRKRKHVDWEIHASLSAKVGSRKGLVVLILPEFPVSPYDENGNFDQSRLYPHLHPRTAENLRTGYADLYFWPGMYPALPSVEVDDLIENAAVKRETHEHLVHTAHPQYHQDLT